MSDLIKGFRTIGRCSIYRQVRINGVLTLLPIALASPPEEISIDPKDKIEKMMVKACDGRKVIGLTYPDSSEPEVMIKFPAAVMELESLMHGRVVAEATGSTEVWAFAEFNSSNPPAARITGELGFSVTAQTEAASKALVNYIDPDTRLAVKVAVKDTSAILTGDQCSIGAAMLFELSPELEAKGVDIYAWVPCSVANATIMTSESIGLITIFAQGISFEGKARSLMLWNCSRTESAPIDDKSERTIKLSILDSTLSTSGLGWDAIDTPLKAVC